MLSYLDQTEQAVNFYYTVENNRTGIKITFAIIYIVVVSMLLFLTIVLAITFAGKLTRPIINLISASKNISSGQLDSKVPEIETDEEIKILNTNFNNMIERLKVQQDKLLVAERFSAWETVARKLAHEIKNPLTPIQLSIDRLREKPSNKFEGDKKEFNTYLETINRQIIDKKLVDEFSGFARMPSPILRRVDIKKILVEAIEFYKLSHKNLRFILNFENVSEKYIIDGDREQLNRFFLNLIKNSIESIAEKKEKNTNLLGKITVEIHKNNEYIVIKMQDNGIGFKDIKNILKPYYTTKEWYRFRITYSFKIINEHDGEIRFKKNPDGAEIDIYIPSKL